MEHIQDINAALITSPTGQEGILSIPLSDGFMCCIVDTELEKLQEMKPYMQAVANKLKTPVKIVKFVRVELLEEVFPQENDGN